MLLLLASLQLQNANYRAAAEQCEAAVAVDDGMPEVFSTWGLALFRLGDHQAAAEKLERATELDPDDHFARYNLGVIYMDYLDLRDEALAQFREYVDRGGSKSRVSEWIRALGG